MNYKRILISEAEKRRILGMHNNGKKNPTTNNFLFEDENTAGCEACNAKPPASGEIVNQVQKYYFIDGKCEERTGGSGFSSLEECENCNCGEKIGETPGGETQDPEQKDTPTDVKFSECLTTPGYREITGQELLDKYGKRFPCIQAAAAVIDPQSKFVTVAEGTINKYGLYVYSSNPKVCIICKEGKDTYEIRPYGCRCDAGKYRTIRGKAIGTSEITNFIPMEDNPKTKAECKPLSGDEVIKDKNCKNLSPYQVVTSLGLNWRETRDKWVENGCNGTTPCIKGDARTNINLRSAICDGTYDPRNPQKGGTKPGKDTPIGQTPGGEKPGDDQKRFIEPIFPGDQQGKDTPVAD